MDEKVGSVQPQSQSRPKANPKYLLWGLLLAPLFIRQLSFFQKEQPQDPFQTVFDALEINLAANWSERYTSEAHLPGTNFGLVQWTRDKFEEYGLKASIDTYDVYVSYPESHALSLLDSSGKVVYEAPLVEDEIPEDSTSSGEGLVPTFVAYGANGNVTAEYVYVNYGSSEDFAQLKEWGVEVKGKIAIARYGHIFRGLKVKFAQDNGAAGVLLYTDPSEDGGVTAANGFKEYPHGPARQESSVQRGSVQFLGGVGSAPGDPTTPGYASKGNVERQDPHVSTPKIPVLPVSYRDVKPILAALSGHGLKAPKEWRGEVEGYDYHIGPSAGVELNLFSNQTFNITPLWNVYGEIEGERTDEVIIIGNHRDAWIKGGAGDPNSGSAVLIEIARALGQLKQSGYKFKRTIILQSYDGEEYGLLGSTEFGEYAAHNLQKKVVAYLNMDVAVVGRFLSLGASPLLNKVLRKVAAWLPYPEKGVGSLYDHFVKEGHDNIHNLGSGSDYTVFLEHLGIPSADLGFKQGKGDAIYQYHSNYDSFHWMSHYGDKGFVYHNLAAKYLAGVALELSEKEVTDFSLEDYTADLLKYYDELTETIPRDWYDKTVSHHAAKEYLEDLDLDAYVSEISQNHYYPRGRWYFPELMVPFRCSHDKRMMMIAPEHHTNFTLGTVIGHTRKQLERLHAEARDFDLRSDELQQQHEDRDQLSWWRKIKLHFEIKHHNKLLQYFERNFLHDKGLFQREWFRHIVFASGRRTGYAGQTWPGIREAVEDEDVGRAVKWFGIAARAAKRARVSLD